MRPSDVDDPSITDMMADFESIYQIATVFLSLVHLGEELPIDISLLPDSGTLTKHLFGSLSYSRSDSSGSETMSTSPFGHEVAVLVAAGIAGAAGLIVGRMGHGREFCARLSRGEPRRGERLARVRR